MSKSPEIFDGKVRLNVADAFMEMVNSGALEPEVADEVIPRLLPENYPELQTWNAAAMPPAMAASSNEALRTLAANDRLTREQADQARMYLGTLTTAA